jgi:hypothetical protein
VKTLSEIWAYALRVSTRYEDLAEFCDADPRDETFKELLRSMATSGFLRSCFRGYQAGIRPPEGPMRAALGAVPGHEGPRALPSGVPFPDEVEPVRPPVPAAPAELRELPPGIELGPDGKPRVADNTLDRVAKADIVPGIGELFTEARNLRMAIDDGYLDDEDPEKVLDRLLTKVEQLADQVGYSDVGSPAEVVAFNPQLHVYHGQLPAGGMTAEVIVTHPGLAWTHRDKVVIIRQAFVDLYDDQLGQMRIGRAGDLDNEDDDPRIYLWFDGKSAQRPETYNGPDWYRCTKAFQANSLFADCAQDSCDHPKVDGACTTMLFYFVDADDYLVVPNDQLVTSSPAED